MIKSGFLQGILLIGRLIFRCLPGNPQLVQRNQFDSHVRKIGKKLGEFSLIMRGDQQFLHAVAWKIYRFSAQRPDGESFEYSEMRRPSPWSWEKLDHTPK